MLSNKISLSEALEMYRDVDRKVNAKGVKVGFDYSARNCVARKFKREKEGYDEDYDSYEDEDEEQKSKVDDGESNSVDSTTEYDSITNQLQTLSRQVPFAIGGVGTLQGTSGMFQLSIKPASGSAEFVNIGQVCSLDICKLLECCVQSPYGDLLNNVTKIDPSVRLAMECLGDRVKIERTDPVIMYENGGKRDETLIGAIAEAVQVNLLANATDVEILLNKVNVYSEGGHFQPHTDTPTHDPSLFIGSVVVCLPFQHTGGDLVVTHAGQECVFNFANLSKNGNKIQFAAFYGDCKHQVRPVTSGHRVTLTYSIVKSTNPRFRWNSYYQGLMVDPRNMTISETIKSHSTKALRDIYPALCENFSGDYCGIFLSHAYTASGLHAANLKGADKLLYDFLIDKGIVVSLLAVSSSCHYDEHDRAYRSELGHCYEDRRKVPPCDVCVLSGFEDQRAETHKNIRNDIPFLSRTNASGFVIKDDETRSYNAGNEIVPGSVDRLYIKGAMIVGPFPAAAAVEELEEDFAQLLLTTKDGNTAVTTDLVIISGTVRIPAHKVVLSAKSPVFKAMFEHQMAESASSELVISDFSADIVNALLRCLYDANCIDEVLSGGAGSSGSDVAQDLYAISNKYEIASVARAAERDMVSTMTIDNVVSRLLFADLHSLESVKLAAMQTIVADAEHFFEHTPKLMKLLGGRLMGELCKYMARK